MITILSAMQSSSSRVGHRRSSGAGVHRAGPLKATGSAGLGRRTLKPLIIGLALAVLAGCSALRLGYSNGPQLAWWWLDGYFDFNREQAPKVKRGIEQWFDWHRSTQLADYAALLDKAAAQVTEPTTADAVCQWQTQVTDRLAPAADKAMQLAAELLPLLGEPQIKALEQRYARGNTERREEFLQPDPADRMKASMDRTVKRIEMVYGRLDEPQRKVISAGLAVSPFDAEAWLADNARRQRDVLATLRKLVAERPEADARLTALRALIDRVDDAPSDAARAQQARLREFNCAFAAQIHNATTPAQRQTARENIRSWEADVRSLLLLMP
jgi:Family of unknown function (DUF6279)